MIVAWLSVHDWNTGGRTWYRADYDQARGRFVVIDRDGCLRWDASLDVLRVYAAVSPDYVYLVTYPIEQRPRCKLLRRRMIVLLALAVWSAGCVGVELTLDWRDVRRARQPRPLPPARIVRRRSKLSGFRTV